jgi:DNA-binding NarL/FixJ family response regulator
MAIMKASRDNHQMLIIVLDHHPFICEMITMLQPQASVVTANSFKQLNGLIDKYENVDFAIIEPQSTGCIGALSVNHISKRLPNTEIIIFTDTELDTIGDIYLKKGAGHIICKKRKTKDIMTSLQNVFEKNKPKHSHEVPAIGIMKISKRHRQLINLLDQGCSNQEIALKLDLSENTVKVHFHRLFKILNVSNRLQLLNFARTNGWCVNTTPV